MVTSIKAIIEDKLEVITLARKNNLDNDLKY